MQIREINGLIWTPGYTRGGTRCLGGVKHPLLIDHTRCEPHFMIMNAELSTVKVSVPLVQSNYWYEKCQTTYGTMKVCNY
jgi:hypothetical protein